MFDFHLCFIFSLPFIIADSLMRWERYDTSNLPLLFFFHGTVIMLTTIRKSYRLLNDFIEVQCIYSQTINIEKHHREILANVVQKVFNLSCI